MERTTLVLGVGTDLLDDTLDKTLGECFEALPSIERFNGSTFVKSALVESPRTAWKRMKCTKVLGWSPASNSEEGGRRV